MYLGQVVEKALPMSCSATRCTPIPRRSVGHPRAQVPQQRPAILLKGEITSPTTQPAAVSRPGAVTRPRHAVNPQTLVECSPGHFIACCRYKEIQEHKEDNENANHGKKPWQSFWSCHGAFSVAGCGGSKTDSTYACGFRQRSHDTTGGDAPAADSGNAAPTRTAF
jgi:hypothetical protein